MSHISPQKIPVIRPIVSPYKSPYENVIIRSKFGEELKNGIRGNIDVCIKNAKNKSTIWNKTVTNFPNLNLINAIPHTIWFKLCYN